MTLLRNGTDGSDAKVRRILALIRKEGLEVFRDPSSVAIGIIMPVMLVLLFGYGLSLNVSNVPVAIVIQDNSADALDLVAGFRLSHYFAAEQVPSMHQAERMMLGHEVDGIVRIPSDFSRQLALGRASIQVLVNGTDANTARIVEGYAQGAIATWSARRGAEGQPVAAQPIAVESRLWFNAANDSRYFLVPGLIVLVISLIGALLTTLVMAREWERGTFEALFATPVRTSEILLGKTIPYFVMGLFGLMLCVLSGLFLFHVPLRGSILILLLDSMLYLLIALGVGLAVSSATKSQFVASQLTMVLTFLPAMLLSGFMFDLRSMPAAAQVITYLFPARYYVSLLQTLFLAGNIWSVIVPNTLILAGYTMVLMLIAAAATRKKLG